MISTHAPAGGATLFSVRAFEPSVSFLLTPLREGRHVYDISDGLANIFLLTPLREGRLCIICAQFGRLPISTHAPAGGATGKIKEKGTEK